jgi:hypothetical protein
VVGNPSLCNPLFSLHDGGVLLSYGSGPGEEHSQQDVL